MVLKNYNLFIMKLFECKSKYVSRCVYSDLHEFDGAVERVVEAE